MHSINTISLQISGGHCRTFHRSAAGKQEVQLLEWSSKSKLLLSDQIDHFLQHLWHQPNTVHVQHLQHDNQSINRSTDQSINQSIDQLINWSINQSINWSVNQSINRSTDQSINQSIDQLISQSINQSINWSINQSINRSIDQSINQAHAEKFTCKAWQISTIVKDYFLAISR